MDRRWVLGEDYQEAGRFLEKYNEPTPVLRQLLLDMGYQDVDTCYPGPWKWGPCTEGRRES